MSLGKRIKQIRVDRGLSKTEFGKHFGLESQSSLVSKWEKDFCIPNNERLKVIADLAGVSVSDLLDDNPLSDFSTQELEKELLKRKEMG